jgi:hypothetical protein
LVSVDPHARRFVIKSVLKIDCGHEVFPRHMRLTRSINCGSAR